MQHRDDGVARASLVGDVVENDDVGCRQVIDHLVNVEAALTSVEDRVAEGEVHSVWSIQIELLAKLNCVSFHLAESTRAGIIALSVDAFRQVLVEGLKVAAE